MSKKLVYIMPRIRVSPDRFGQVEVRLGKASFLPDEDATWSERINKARPSCLNVFREFPRGEGEVEPPMARGTVLIADDETWLRENVPYVVAVAYILGIQQNLWQYPSEAFQYIDISADDVQHDMVRFHTKTNPLIEDTASFRLLPPLELVGCRGNFAIDVQNDVFTEFSNRLESDSPDRLIVSCYHLFRTQFANGFLAPARQDFAAYCASLEAAFDVPKSQDGGSTLADYVEGFYKGYSGLRDFIRGLYEERSVFNHGVSEINPDPRRIALLAAFRQTTFRWDLLRHTCLDVIHEKAREAAGKPRGDIGKFFSKSFRMIETCFSSREAWESLCKELTKKGSVKSVLNLQETGDNPKEDDSRLSGFIGLCCRFLFVHTWTKGDLASEASKAIASLRCLAEIIHATSTDSTVKQAAEELHAAAKSSDQERLGLWARKQASWTMIGGYNGLCDAAQAVAAHIAQLFAYQGRL